MQNSLTQNSHALYERALNVFPSGVTHDNRYFGEVAGNECIKLAMAQTAYDKLEDNSFVGRIPACKGVIAFGTTLRECQNELRSTLEDWVLLGLKLGHPLPVVAR